MLLVVRIFFAVLVYCLLTGCDAKSDKLNGYIEAKLTYLSAPFAGKLVDLNVVRGQSVKLSEHLFSLEPLPESADLSSALESLNVATAKLANLQKGKRPSELDEIIEKIEGEKANITYLTTAFKRRKSLVSKSALEQEALDLTVKNLAESTAQLKSLQASLVTAKLPARIDEVKAAQYEVESAKASVEKARWAVKEKTVDAPKNATVFDTYFRAGENVPANHPVLSLLAAKDIKVVFFIPQAILTHVQLGQKIKLSCDSCQQDINATIRFISPMAEFTPPIIYSKTARSKLVYRVEGSIDDLAFSKLHPGQPVDIVLPQAVK